MRWWFVPFLAGCFPDVSGSPALVDGPRVLAIRSVPAEAAPGEAIRLQALVASPRPASERPSPAWAWCTEPRSAEERTAVTVSCATGDTLQSITASPTVLPDACARFGPISPPVGADEPPRRPVDPDPTGGYYLPAAAQLNESLTFGFVRLSCDLSGATRDIFDAYQDRYQANEHPTIASIDAPAQANAGAPVTLTLTVGDGAAEPYVLYRPETNELTDETERLTVNWYVTAGELDLGQTDVSEGRAVVEWTPPASGPVSGWAVLRDDRGGSSWTEFGVEVR